MAVNKAVSGCSISPFFEETGNISSEGNAADLLNDLRVKKAYLGQ